MSFIKNEHYDILSNDALMQRQKYFYDFGRIFNSFLILY